MSIEQVRKDVREITGDELAAVVSPDLGDWCVTWVWYDGRTISLDMQGATEKELLAALTAIVSVSQ